MKKLNFFNLYKQEIFVNLTIGLLWLSGILYIVFINLNSSNSYYVSIPAIVLTLSVLLIKLQFKKYTINLDVSYAKTKLELEEALNSIMQMQIASERLASEIIKRTEVERDIKKIKSFLKEILNAMPSILVAIDIEKKVIEWNKEATLKTNISREQALGKCIEALLPIVNASHIDGALHSGLVEKLDKFLEPGTSDIYFDIIIYPIKSNDFTGAVIRIDDVSSQVRIESMLVHTEKMMSVGNLAAGMAHEINNPLGVIVQGAQNIERRINEGLPANIAVALECGTNMTAIYQYLEKRQIISFLSGMKEACAKASDIVKNMLQFTKKCNKNLVLENIHDLIDKAMLFALNDYDLKKNYDIRSIVMLKEYDPNSKPVLCLNSEFEQVILNLIKNAVQSIACANHKRGQLILRTKFSNEFVKIEIQDNGCGMTDDTKRRAFEPFFTTQEVGKGTGFGLSVAYFIICTNHQGKMTIESNLGQGTTVSIALPLKNLNG